jgi:hypothetical protein
LTPASLRQPDKVTRSANRVETWHRSLQQFGLELRGGDDVGDHDRKFVPAQATDVRSWRLGAHSRHDVGGPQLAMTITNDLSMSSVRRSNTSPSSTGAPEHTASAASSVQPPLKGDGDADALDILPSPKACGWLKCRSGNESSVHPIRGRSERE